MTWPEIILSWVITASIAGCAAYFGSYLRRKGEQQATAEALADIVKQVAATTRAAEEIKREINHADWADREWKSIRRVKLEELVTAISEATDFAGRFASYSLFDEPNPEQTARNPYFRMSALVNLFFPEMAAPLSIFGTAIGEHRQYFADSHIIRLERGPDHRLAVVAERSDGGSRLFQQILDAGATLQVIASEVMRASR